MEKAGGCPGPRATTSRRLCRQTNKRIRRRQMRDGRFSIRGKARMPRMPPESEERRNTNSAHRGRSCWRHRMAKGTAARSTETPRPQSVPEKAGRTTGGDPTRESVRCPKWPVGTAIAEQSSVRYPDCRSRCTRGIAPASSRIRNRSRAPKVDRPSAIGRTVQAVVSLYRMRRVPAWNGPGPKRWEAP